MPVRPDATVRGTLCNVTRAILAVGNASPVVYRSTDIRVVRDVFDSIFPSHTVCRSSRQKEAGVSHWVHPLSLSANALFRNVLHAVARVEAQIWSLVILYFGVSQQSKVGINVVIDMQYVIGIYKWQNAHD